jgi:hypothetical protein
MDEPRIRDIPSFKRQFEELEQFEALRGCLPIAAPFLKRLGIDTDSMSRSLEGLDGLRETAERIASIPDRFNYQFAARGWIMHGDMNLDAAVQATELAESGDMDAAEARLLSLHGSGEVKWMLRRMSAVEAFRPRMRLATLALEDYRDGRYHACVPVVLALLDGVVSQLHEERRGFFAENADLSAWDSIAAHERGLNVLTTIFQKGRRTLNEDPIDIPYRHGILHGWDVAYDNRIVAAKTWAALFSVREWAIKAERGELEEPEPTDQPSWRQLFADIARNKEVRERIEAWEPRGLEVGVDVTSHGPPEFFGPGTPERHLVEYLNYWQERNYGYMAGHAGMPVHDGEVTPQQIREIYEGRTLKAFDILAIEDQAPSASKIDVTLHIEDEGDLTEKTVSFRLVYWHRDENVVIRGDADGEWTVVNWYV